MCPRRLPRRTGIRVAELSAFGRARQDLFGTCCQVANSGMAIFGRLDMSSRRRTARARILCCERQIFRGAPGRMSPPAHRVRRGYGLFKWRSARKRTKKGNIYWANHLVATRCLVGLSRKGQLELKGNRCRGDPLFLEHIGPLVTIRVSRAYVPILTYARQHLLSVCS